MRECLPGVRASGRGEQNSESRSVLGRQRSGYYVDLSAQDDLNGCDCCVALWGEFFEPKVAILNPASRRAGQGQSLVAITAHGSVNRMCNDCANSTRSKNPTN
jgi:hypothetical protein